MTNSVNYLLSMGKSLRTRLEQLNELKCNLTSRTRWICDGNERTEEPTYDIKEVDKKITEINKALFLVDHKIKESNAKTMVDIDISYDTLIGEIS